MIRFTIGDIRISIVPETGFAFPHDLILPASTRAELDAIDWLGPPFYMDDGTVGLAIQAFVIEADGKRIVVDTCIGNDKPRAAPPFDMLKTDFLERFEAAGFARDTIDVVLCTHLHVDHVGWNTLLRDGRWVPTFPNARYLIGRAEHNFWTEVAKTREGDATQMLGDSVQPLFDHGLVDLIETDHRVCDGVRLLPTPGHTPGHVSVAIDSGGQRALLTGDFVHNPAQIARPDWSNLADEDGSVSEATRREQFAAITDLPVLLIGTHFPAPTGGYVVSDGAAFRFEPHTG